MRPHADSPRPVRGASRLSVILLVAVLASLGALVASFYPARGHFQPAPLRSNPPGCVKTAGVFVPTNATGIPVREIASVPAPLRTRVLYRANMQACSCGCNQSIVACRVRDTECATSRKLLREIVSDRGQ
ncbi:MAG: hypothetical protein ACRD1N_05280 [Terriglobia bacterium]